MGIGGPLLCLLSAICVPSRGQVLALALQAFLELMEHGMVSWEILSTRIVKKVGGISQTAGGWGRLGSSFQQWDADLPCASSRW